jgi:hypothetical protein
MHATKAKPMAPAGPPDLTWPVLELPGGNFREDGEVQEAYAAALQDHVAAAFTKEKMRSKTDFVEYIKEIFQDSARKEKYMSMPRNSRLCLTKIVGIKDFVDFDRPLLIYSIPDETFVAVSKWFASDIYTDEDEPFHFHKSAAAVFTTSKYSSEPIETCHVVVSEFDLSRLCAGDRRCTLRDLVNAIP